MSPCSPQEALADATVPRLHLAEFIESGPHALAPRNWARDEVVDVQKVVAASTTRGYVVSASVGAVLGGGVVSGALLQSRSASMIAAAISSGLGLATLIVFDLVNSAFVGRQLASIFERRDRRVRAEARSRSGWDPAIIALNGSLWGLGVDEHTGEGVYRRGEEAISEEAFAGLSPTTRTVTSRVSTSLTLVRVFSTLASASLAAVPLITNATDFTWAGDAAVIGGATLVGLVFSFISYGIAKAAADESDALLDELNREAFDQARTAATPPSGTDPPRPSP